LTDPANVVPVAPWTLDDPVFRVYVIAAALMILKMAGHAWWTVALLTRYRAGYRLEEDARSTWMNPDGHPDQLRPDERVERTRRIHMNEIENVPLFLAAGLLFVATGPSLLVARILFYGYVATRFCHLFVVVTRQAHEWRATFWTIGSLMIIGMAVSALFAALR
jgi:glutathione S-transferase